MEPDAAEQSVEQPQGDSRAKQYVEMVEKARRLRAPRTRQWKLNQAFFEGNQYAYVNRRSRRIEQLGTEPGEKPRYRVRLMSNQITRNALTMVAKLNKSRPAFYATPNDTDIDSAYAAAVAESLMNFWWDNLRIDKTVWSALINARISGGFIKVEWDEEAGAPMEYMVDPEGNPIIEYSLQRLFEEELNAVGIDPAMFRQTAFTGDIKLSVLSGHQVIIDPAATTFDEADWVVCVHGVSPERMKAIYGLDVRPDSTPMVVETSPSLFPGVDSQVAHEDTVKEVFRAYFKPTPVIPQGRYVVFIKNPDTILYEGPWPYPFRRLPLVKMPGTPIPGSPYDKPEIEDAIPLQRELNRSISQVVENKNLTVAPQLLAPVGSMRERRTTEPGAVFTFNPVAGMRPEAIPIQAIPSYVLQHIADTTVRLKEVFGLNEVSTGTPPPNVEAALAIDLLQEMSMDSLAPMIDEIEASIADLGNMMIAMAAQYYDAPRILSMVGSAAKIKVSAFLKAKNNLANGSIIRVEAGSKMPRTRAGRQARILQLKNEGVITPAQAQKWLDLADFTGLRGQLEADENHALREHERLLQGMPINPMALWSAEQAVMAGAAPPEALMQAAMSPNDWDNHAGHLDAHLPLMKSIEFETWPVELQQALSQHVKMHMDALASQQPQDMKAPQITLQTRAALGPSAVAALFDRAGMAVPPTIFLEPPLDTVVFDSKDKANADDPITQAREDVLAQSEIELNQAKTEEALARADATRRSGGGPAED